MLEDRFFSRQTDEEGLTFGLVFQGDVESKSVYGVTCYVYEKGVDNQGHITVKSRAHQRFVVIKNENGELASSRNQIFYAKVKILPEILLPNPLLLTISNNMMKQMQNSKISNSLKSFLASSSVFPAFVYDQYSIVTVCEKIERYLAMLNVEAPTDAILKSFWLARNLPLNQADRLKIFINNCVNKRMLIIGQSLNYVSVKFRKLTYNFHIINCFLISLSHCSCVIFCVKDVRIELQFIMTFLQCPKEM
jgi:cereblon